MSNQDLLEQQEGYQNFPVPSAPLARPVPLARPIYDSESYNDFRTVPRYNLNPARYESPPLTQSTDDTLIFVVEEVPRKIPEDDVSIMVIYICAILALFIPFIGIIYLCCFGICCKNIREFKPRRKKAIKILLLTTLFGVLWGVVFSSLVGEGEIKLN